MCKMRTDIFVIIYMDYFHIYKIYHEITEFITLFDYINMSHKWDESPIDSGNKCKVELSKEFKEFQYNSHSTIVCHLKSLKIQVTYFISYTFSSMKIQRRVIFI